MNQKNMVTGALVLSFAAIFVRIAGFVFRVYLSNSIGSEGMGVYMLIISMYNFCVTLATSGVSIAVSTLTAEQLSIGKPANARRVLRCAVLLAVILSCTVCTGVIIFAEPIGIYILKDSRTIVSLRILALGIPFLAISSCLRGYFVASRRAGNPAAGQILEQLIKMAFIVCILGYFIPKGIEYACAVVVAGISIGELSCFLFSFWGYVRARKKRKDNSKADISNTTSKIAVIIAPLAVTAYIRSALRLAEEVLILSGLKTFSGNIAEATSTYGMLKGMVMPLLLFPLSLLSSFVITLTPEISRINAVANTRKLESAVSKILGYTFLAGMFVVVVFMSFPAKLGNAIYQNNQVGEMLKSLSFLCPFMCIEMVVVGILNGIGEQASSMRYALADSVLRITMIYFLIPISGMRGFMAMMIASNIFTSVLNLAKLLKITSVPFHLNDWVLKPVLAAAASSQIVAVFMNYGLFGFFSERAELALYILITGIFYFFILLSIGSIRAEDFKWIISRIKSSPKKLREDDMVNSV